MTYIFALIALLLISCALVWFMILTQMRRLLRSGAKLAIERAWLKVMNEKNQALKVIEADKVLDQALKMLGYKGTLGEKLKQANPRFQDAQAVWSAHKLRNVLAHELNAPLKDSDARRAIASFRKALQDLGAAV